MISAGTELDVTVTYLEIAENPNPIDPQLPDGNTLIRVTDPPVWYFLSLYNAVGRDWEWRDRLGDSEDTLRDFVGNPSVELWTLTAKGWPQGFFQLDYRQGNIVDIAYFGLVPEAVGKGLGKKMLQAALAKAWSCPTTQRVTVNTCTLDHPAALSLYKSCGFRPIKQQVTTRILHADRLAPLAEPA